MQDKPSPAHTNELLTDDDDEDVYDDAMFKKEVFNEGGRWWNALLLCRNFEFSLPISCGVYLTYFTNEIQ